MPTKTVTPDIDDPTLDVPEPKPGDPGYDWSQHYGTDDLYIHTFSNGGKVVALRPLSSIFSKTWLFRMSVEVKTDVDLEFAAVKRAACPEALEVLLSVDDSIGGEDMFEELWKGWTAADSDGEALTTKN